MNGTKKGSIGDNHHMLQNNCFLPLGDVIDHLSIHILYRKHAPSDHDIEAHSSYQVYFDHDERLSPDRKQHYLKQLSNINQKMWLLEGRLRAPDGMSLEVLGQIAINLREHNKKRIAIKKRINLEASKLRKLPTT